ncbi:MAG: RnfABCDGE type electron transport complex subunit G [Desulfosudaceae bacterium]
MRELIKMVVVLTVLTAVSGGLLAGLRAKTQDRIEMQELQFVSGPVLEDLFGEADNNMIEDRFELTHQDEEVTVFPIKSDGEYQKVAFSAAGGGYGGDIGVMVGVDISNDTITGVRVTTHSETPGIGSRAKSNPELIMPKFEGLEAGRQFKVKSAGGQIDAISGATVTSKGICSGVTRAGDFYSQNKARIKEQLNSL